MSKRSPKPCAQWAEQLTQASFDHLSDEARAALNTHLAVCPACAAVRADYLYTLALLRQTDGSVPLPGLPPSLLQAWATEAQRAPARRPTRFGQLQEVPMQFTDDKAASALPPTPPTWRQRASHRGAAAISAVAAVLVIAVVMMALFASHMPGKPPRTGSGPSTSTPTTPTPVQPINPQWQALPHLANLPLSGWDWVGLAPSNPNVIYQITSNDHGASFSLQRSDDQGATWQNLPVPSGPQESLAELYISPTNALHVLALAQIECPSSQASVNGPLSPLSDGKRCSVIYFSSNGGESWAPVTLPAHGSHNLFMGMGIFAQENRLYAILYVDPGYTASELVESLDDGATWQFADQGLTPDQNCLQGIAGPATGTTLYVETQNYCGSSSSGQVTTQIWRSGDAGAHWTQVSSSKNLIPEALWAVNVSGQSKQILLTLSPLNLTLQFSLDEGKSWQSAPTLGNSGAYSSIVGILHDGSVLAQSDDGFYTWKGGDASWHKVAPALGGIFEGAQVFFDQASGKEKLYAEARPTQDATSYSYYSIDLP